MSDLWHVRHFENPRAISPRSIMPAYPHLLTAEMNFDRIQSRVDAMVMLGVPYGDAVNKAPAMAREQAVRIAASIASAGGESGLETKEIVAMIAYMQRLGRDAQIPMPIDLTKSTPPDTAPRATPTAPGGGASK